MLPVRFACTFKLDLMLFVKKAICTQCPDEIYEKVMDTSMAGMFNVADIFLLIVNSFNNRPLFSRTVCEYSLQKSSVKQNISVTLSMMSKLIFLYILLYIRLKDMKTTLTYLLFLPLSETELRLKKAKERL